MNEKKTVLSYAAELLKEKCCVSVNAPINSDVDYSKLLSLLPAYHRRYLQGEILSDGRRAQERYCQLSFWG